MDDQKFEKIKYWIELIKWFIVSVALVLASSIVSWNFTSRDKSFEEVKFYSEKYLTELIVLNEKIGPRYKLAQFFKNVTVNKEQRKGWERYFEDVKKEYTILVKLDSSKQAERQEILKKDTSRMTTFDKRQLEYLNNKIEQIEIELKSELKLPNTKPERYYIIVGGDKTLDEAKYERNKYSDFTTKIIYRNNSYRTVVEFTTYEAAIQNIKKIRSLKDDAYLVNAAKWCSNMIAKGDYYECH